MEDEPEASEEADDPGAKFNRLLDENACDAVVVYWPRGAKMAATYAEITILVERSRRGERVPDLHYLNDERTMDFHHGRLRIKEQGGRHLYLKGASRLAAMAWPWRTRDGLHSAVAWCGAKVAGHRAPLPKPAKAMAVARG